MLPEVRRGRGVERPEVSIVIPAYNEAGRIEGTLRSLMGFFDERGVDYEVLVVMDGCSDGTTDIVSKMAEENGSLIPLIYPRRLGKGGALIRGLRYARGDYVLLLDADGPTPPWDLYRLIGEADGCGLIIGSRYVEGSRVSARQRLIRILLSRAFNLLVRLMFPRLRGIRDTQCGVKVLRREVVEKICDDLFVTDFAFDVNLIYSTILRGFNVKEVGVTWRHVEEGSKLRNLLRASIKMLLSLIRLRIYYSRLRPILYSKPMRVLTDLIYGRLY